MLRYLLLFALFYFVYRVFLRPIVRKILQPLKGPSLKKNSARTTSHSGHIESMQKCPTCQTYNPISSAIFFKGNYFCNEQCRNDFTLNKN